MLRKFIQKKCNIYSGYIYKMNDGVYYINKKNLNEKTEVIEGPIFYKRGFMDLYVKEINSGKIIFTYSLKKLIKFPKKYFVAIDKRRKFNEPLITLSYTEIAKKHNLNIITDSSKILKLMMNQKSDLVEAYNKEKPTNYKEILDEKMGKSNEFNIDLKSKIENIKGKIKTLNLREKINDIKNKFNKKENIEEIKSCENKIIEEVPFVEDNNEIIKEENIDYNNKIIEEKPFVEEKKEVIEEDVKITNKIEEEFKDNIEGLKVKKYDLCKEPKYIYGFNLKVKPVINLSTNGKSFEQVITEMMYLNNLDYNVYADIDGVKISTRVLKTTEELVEYYNFKKNDIFPTTTNAKIMARASRKLEKQKTKNMI